MHIHTIREFVDRSVGCWLEKLCKLLQRSFEAHDGSVIVFRYPLAAYRAAAAPIHSGSRVILSLRRLVSRVDFHLPFVSFRSSYISWHFHLLLLLG